MEGMESLLDILRPKKGEAEFLLLRAILCFQASVVVYYALNIALALMRAFMGWNPPKGARSVRLLLETWEDADTEQSEEDEDNEQDEQGAGQALPAYLKMS